MGLKDQFMGPAMALMGNNASIDDIVSKLEQMRSVINKVSQSCGGCYEVLQTLFSSNGRVLLKMGLGLL